MNAEERAIIDRTNQLVQELMDRDWLELGVSQEELDQSRLRMQEFYAKLDSGKSFDEVLQQWDCLPSKKASNPEAAVQQLLQPNAE